MTQGPPGPLRRLRPDALVACEATEARTRVLVAAPDVVAVFDDLPSLPAPLEAPDLDRLVAGQIEVLSEALAGPDADSLVEELKARGLLTQEPPVGLEHPPPHPDSEAPSTGVLRLRSALELVRDGRPLPLPACVTTHDEILVLPRATPPHVLRRALRLFVSRLASPWSEAYGCVAASRPVVVSGDSPRPGSLPEPEEASWPHAPVSVLALHPTPHRTGLIEADGDGTAESGRLAVAEVVSGPRPSPLPSRVLAVGTFAQSNLAAGDPFGKPDPRWCKGVGSSAAEARVKCVGEGTERFVLGDVRSESLVASAAVDLEGPWLDPRSVVAYSAEQASRQGLVEFDPRAPEYWMRGVRGVGVDVWVPAALVYMPFPLPRWLAPGYQSSNGAAAHPSKTRAAVSAWLEAVERDAFLRCFYGRTPPPRLSARSIPPEARDLMAELPPTQRRELLALPSPSGIPAWAVVEYGDDGFGVGAAAGPGADVVAHAVAELATSRVGPDPDLSPENVATPTDHGALYRAPHHAASMKWILSGPVVDADPEQWAEHHVVTLPDRVIRVVLADEPLPVVRVIDPELIPVTFGFDREPLGRADVRVLCSSSGRLPSDAPLTPHPFA